MYSTLLKRFNKVDDDACFWSTNVLNSGAETLDSTNILIPNLTEYLLNLRTRIGCLRLSAREIWTQYIKKSRRASTFADNGQLDWLPRTSNNTEVISQEACLELVLYSYSQPSSKIEMTVVASSSVREIFSGLCCESFPRNESSLYTSPLDRKNIIKATNSSDVCWGLIKLSGNGMFFGLDSQLDNIVRLENACWGELDVRLFEPYAVIHGGICGHILQVKQLKMSKCGFRLPKTSVTRKKEKRRLCQICEQFNAVFMAVYSHLLPENPCYLCNDCLENLHYDSQGHRTSQEFTLFPYIGDH